MELQYLSPMELHQMTSFTCRIHEDHVKASACPLFGKEEEQVEQ